MTKEMMYRKMAEYIREHGFSPRFDAGNSCGCFIYAWSRVSGEHVAPPWEVEDVIGGSFGTGDLRDGGWTEDAAKDAAAACEIAADLVAK